MQATEVHNNLACLLVGHEPGDVDAERLRRLLQWDAVDALVGVDCLEPVACGREVGTAVYIFELTVEGCQSRAVFTDRVAESPYPVLEHPALLAGTRHGHEYAFFLTKGHGGEVAVSPVRILAGHVVEDGETIAAIAIEHVAPRPGDVVVALHLARIGECLKRIGQGLAAADPLRVRPHAVPPFVEQRAGPRAAAATLDLTATVPAAGVPRNHLVAVALRAGHPDLVLERRLGTPERHRVTGILVQSPEILRTLNRAIAVPLGFLRLQLVHPGISVAPGLTTGKPHEMLALDVRRARLAGLGVIRELGVRPLDVLRLDQPLLDTLHFLYIELHDVRLVSLAEATSVEETLAPIWQAQDHARLTRTAVAAAKLAGHGVAHTTEADEVSVELRRRRPGLSLADRRGGLAFGHNLPALAVEA